VLHCFDYFVFVLSFEIRKSETSSFLLPHPPPSKKIVLTMGVSLVIPHEFKNGFFISAKNIGILMWIALSL